MDVSKMSFNERKKMFDNWQSNRHEREFGDFGNDIYFSKEELLDVNYECPEFGKLHDYGYSHLAYKYGKKCKVDNKYGTFIRLGADYQDFFYHIKFDDGTEILSSPISGIDFL